jgi:hypothetical protein
MRKLLLSLLALILAIGAWASPMKATWIEGKVEKQKGSSWITLNIGDMVDSADTIRLAKASMAEFSDGARKIVLSSAGTFSLEALSKAGASQASKASGTLGKLAKIVDPKAAPGQNTVGGVRGAAIGSDTDTMSWAGDDEEIKDKLAAAQNLVHDGKYREAATAFGQVASMASDSSQTAQALYGQAWSLAADGSTLQAIKILRAMSAEGAWAAPRALLLARLDIMTSAVDEAKALLKGVIGSGALAGEDLDMAKAMLKEIE